MTRRIVEAALAVVGVVVAVWLWRSGMHTGTFTTSGELRELVGPATPDTYTSTYYDGARIGGAVAVLAVSVLAAADAIVRPGSTR